MKKWASIACVIFLAAQALYAGFTPSQGSFTGSHAGSTFVAGAAAQPILGVRNDGNSVIAPFDLGYGNVSIDSFGRLKTTVVVNAAAEGATATTGALTDAASTFKLVAGINFSTLTAQPLTLTTGGLLRTDGSSVVQPVTATGKIPVNHFRRDYTAASVVTGAYAQVLAATAAPVTDIEIFDSSGQTLVLATGAPGFETDQFFIFPGGNDGRVKFTQPSGTALSVKAVSANATAGELSVNLYR